jgi:hypothetical protein
VPNLLLEHGSRIGERTSQFAVVPVCAKAGAARMRDDAAGWVLSGLFRLAAAQRIAERTMSSL